MNRFQDDENVVRAVFHFGPLVLVAAVLDMQRVKMVSLRQDIQFWVRGVAQVMPDHDPLWRYRGHRAHDGEFVRPVMKTGD